mgnify:CR=1 FL=1
MRKFQEKIFVNKKSSHNAENDELNRCLEVIKNASSYSGITVKEAYEYISKQEDDDDLPF